MTRVRSLTACTAAFPTVLLLCATFHPVAAQNAGDRVRVVIAGDTLVGDVIETSETGFTMTLSSGFMSGYEAQRDVAYGQVETLEVRTCCMDYARLLVVAGGLLLGAGLGEQTNQETCSETVILLPFPTVSETCTREGHNELWGGLIGGPLGWGLLRDGAHGQTAPAAMCRGYGGRSKSCPLSFFWPVGAETADVTGTSCPIP